MGSPGAHASPNPGSLTKPHQPGDYGGGISGQGRADSPVLDLLAELDAAQPSPLRMDAKHPPAAPSPSSVGSPAPLLRAAHPLGEHVAVQIGPEPDQERSVQVTASWHRLCEQTRQQMPSAQSLLTHEALQPKTDEDLEACRALIACVAEHDQSGAKTAALLACLKSLLPPSVFTGSPKRIATTLQALLEDRTTPEMLHRASAMGWWRDFGAQLTVSTGGYVGSFFTYNGLLAKLMRSGAKPSVQGVVPPLAHTATSMAMQRFLRTAEMYPGWTRPVEADAKGVAAPAIKTDRGFLKTAAQYWPFAFALTAASAGTPDPATASSPAEALDRGASRVEFRRDWGFAATSGVAMHRMLAFDRDPVWLDASTPMKRQAMKGAIAELTSPMHTAAATLKYAVFRPIAGVAGLLGVDLHQRAYESWERMAGVTQESKSAHQWPKSEASPACQSPGLTLVRASALCLPMFAFSAFRALTGADPEHSLEANLGTDALLIAGWGLAMAGAERAVATDDGMRTDAAWRGERFMTSLARRAGPPPRPTDVAPAAQSPA